MRGFLASLGLALASLAGPALAQTDHGAIATRALTQHILPGYERLATETAALADTAAANCAGATPPADPIAAAYHRAFDAWMGVSHLGFGPAEENGAAFALAFWPDTRGATPRALAELLAAEDPVVDDPAAFREVSVAARGFFALDHLLFDPDAPPLAPQTYRCRLATAIAADLAASAAMLRDRWRDVFGPLLTSAGAPGNPAYLAPDESTRALYSALTTGLQADIDLRLGRPLGTFDEPQPRRAEAWRSGRSLRNATLSVAALRDLATTAFLPELPPEDAAAIAAAFATALATGDRIGSPIPEAVAAPQTRLRVEAFQNEIEHVRDVATARIGPALGVSSGFNSMDGD